MRYFRLYRKYLWQELKQATANRGDFLIGFVTILLYQILGLTFIGVIFLNVSEIQSWRFEEVLFILGFFHLASGLFYMHFAWTLRFSERYIIKRQLDALLVRPLNPYFQIIAEGLGSSIQEIFSCLLGVLLMALAASMLQLDWTFDKVLWIGMGVSLGVVILGGLFTILAALSFWVLGSASLASPLMSLMDFAQYPTDIYNRYIRFVLTFVIPLGFIAFYPSAGVLRTGYQHYILMAAVLAVVVGGGGYSLWQLGLKRYESAGH
jgi:ABC-2 type transport system permease protein